MIAFNVKEQCIVYFYDLKDNKLESISINLNLTNNWRLNNLQNSNNDDYNEIVNIMNIDNKRILLFNNIHGIILNIKINQIEAKIKIGIIYTVYVK